MTTEELIVGHFEKSLTLEEERVLQERLAQSPETRTMYDQYRSLEATLGNDASAVAPSSRLDEATVAAALSLLPQAIGGGLLGLLSSKVVVGVTVAVIGGISIAIFANRNSSDNGATVAPPAPAVRVVPATPSAQPPVVAPPAEERASSGTPTPENTQPVSAAATPKSEESTTVKGAPNRTGAQAVGVKPARKSGSAMTIDVNHAPVIDNGTHVKPNK
ncbi:MAG TPA: hypothetical protein VHI13_01560 [Candidatus Kapabacteria bacterium]|nr:hypothetical protein [Candidatus Kapabacteria bacterium]